MAPLNKAYYVPKHILEHDYSRLTYFKKLVEMGLFIKY